MRILLLVAMAGILGVAVAGAARAQQGVPAAPSDLTASQAVTGSPDIALAWHDNGDNEDNEDAFRIERSTSENGPWTLVIMAGHMCDTGVPLQCLYMDRSLAYGTTYWYRVAAVNSAGASPYSNVASASTAARPAPQPGTISGVVFDDTNRNGMLDAGEHGLQGRQLALLSGGPGGPTLQTVAAGVDGAYVMQGFAAGAYTVRANVDGHQGICGDGAATFNPLPSSYCVSATMPWHNTTPTEITVTVSDTTGAVADFGARPSDVAVIEGLALLEDDYAPPGTSIAAVVNGQVCGSASMPSADGGYIGDHMFELHIVGVGEQLGCATPGAPVQFRVGGVPAAESFSWVPFSDVTTFGQFQFIFLTAMQQHAWYWYEQSESDLPAVGTLIQAVIGGVVCGEARIESQGTGLSGFSRLIVPSEEIQPGCGRDGAMVSFLFDGVAKGDPIEWRPGLQYINPLVGPVILPTTGSASTNGRKSGLLEAAIASLLGSALLIGTGRLAARRRS